MGDLYPGSGWFGDYGYLVGNSVTPSRFVAFSTYVAPAVFASFVGRRTLRTYTAARSFGSYVAARAFRTYTAATTFISRER